MRPGRSLFISLITSVVGIALLIIVVHLFLSRELEKPYTSRYPDLPVIEPLPGSSDLAPERDYSKEAYVTLLAPSDPHPWTEGKPDYYFEACKVTAHRLLRNATTRDSFNRPFVILATPNVPQKQIRVLESHGAIVKTVATIDPPPGTVDFEKINPRYRDQFTKLRVWSMTEYRRILYLDADTLIIRPLHNVFDTPTKLKGDEEWLFAAVYDSRDLRENKEGHPPGLADKGRVKDKYFSAGVFLLHPTQSQADYIFNMLQDPPKKDFTEFMEQDMLRWAYREGGPYPWIRLSHLYNTQWCRARDLETAHVLHDKFWRPGMDEELKKTWYQAWGEMLGWDAARHIDGIQHWQDESGICNY